MKRKSGMNKKQLGFVVGAIAGLVAAVPLAQAAPTLRMKVDQKGDFVLLGNTLGQECGGGTPAPVVGTVGPCGINTGSSAVDVFWRADEPGAKQATASIEITNARARSTAVLKLPSMNATITYARLYWAAPRKGAVNDTSVLVERIGPGGFSQTVNAVDAPTVATTTTPPTHTHYQSSADVTALVKANGPGDYRISGVDTFELANLNDHRMFVGWWMVVFYQLDTDPPRNLALFDGLDLVEPGATVITATISGFKAPASGLKAKLGVVAYEGDENASGDQITFNDPTFARPLFNGLNPVNNFFNSSRTELGDPVSNDGDLPRLTGMSGSMSGIDLDVVDVTGRVPQNATSATVSVRSTGEFVMLGGLVTSIATFKPDFTNTNKTFRNLTNTMVGAIRPGDVIEYTVTTTNNGNDPGTNVVLTDEIPMGLTYVANSAMLTAGVGLIDFAGRTLTVRLGAGATATMGGTMPPAPMAGSTATVVFKATVNNMVSGTIANQAIVSATGQSGSLPTMYPSDGNGTVPGNPPTTFVIDECLTNPDCAMNMGKPVCQNTVHPFVCVECTLGTDCKVNAKPFCVTATNTCRACTNDAECSATPMTPACQRTGALAGSCTQTGCTSNNDCGGFTPTCNVATGVCGPCVDDDAPSCTNPKYPACQKSGPLAGACTECSGTLPRLCGGAKPVCITSLGFCACTNTKDSDCGGPMSGVVCNAPVGICIPGCGTAADRNRCPAAQMCTGMGDAIGTCVIPACLSDGDCMQPRPRCDLGLMPSSCVQCLANADCKAPFICDAANSKTCVECTPANTNNCSAMTAGTRCLVTNSCGCQVDNDCGGMTSGRVCDSGISKCSPGCRGNGGNACPPGLVCTSSTNAIGRCVTPGTPLDAGVIDAPRDVVAMETGVSVPDAAAVPPGPDATTPAFDAPVSTDATVPAFDAPASTDADTRFAGYLAGGGCRCDVGATPQQRGTALPLLMLAPLGLVLAVRRRNRR